MRTKDYIYVVLGGALIFSLIVLYVFQFRLVSSMVVVSALYIQSAICGLFLFGVLVYVLLKKDFGLTALEKVKVGVSGIFVCLAISPLCIILLNQVRVNCTVETGVVQEVRVRATQRYGLLENEEVRPDYIDVYIRDREQELLKLREYTPFPPVEKSEKVDYERCTGLTGLQWLNLLK